MMVAAPCVVRFGQIRSTSPKLAVRWLDGEHDSQGSRIEGSHTGVGVRMATASRTRKMAGPRRMSFFRHPRIKLLTDAASLQYALVQGEPWESHSPPHKCPKPPPRASAPPFSALAPNYLTHCWEVRSTKHPLLPLRWSNHPRHPSDT